jgi:hypothetical protein
MLRLMAASSSPLSKHRCQFGAWRRMMQHRRGNTAQFMARGLPMQRMKEGAGGGELLPTAPFPAAQPPGEPAYP